jgi:ribosomal protein S24E
MDLNMQKEREMPLMSRKRYTFSVGFKGSTPSRKDIRNAIATKVKADPELTIVKHIYTRFGAENARVIANVYADKKDMQSYEDKKLIEKHSEKKAEEKKEEGS